MLIYPSILLPLKAIIFYFLRLDCLLAIVNKKVRKLRTKKLNNECGGKLIANIFLNFIASTNCRKLNQQKVNSVGGENIAS